MLNYPRKGSNQLSNDLHLYFKLINKNQLAKVHSGKKKIKIRFHLLEAIAELI